MDGSDFNWTVVADRGQFDSGARFAPFAHFRSGYRWRREDRHGPNVCPFTSGGWLQPLERVTGGYRAKTTSPISAFLRGLATPSKFRSRIPLNHGKGIFGERRTAFVGPG